MEILEEFTQALQHAGLKEKDINLAIIINAFRYARFGMAEKLEKFTKALRDEGFVEGKEINLGYNRDDFFNEKEELNAKTKHIPSREYCETHRNECKVIGNFIKASADELVEKYGEAEASRICSPRPLYIDNYVWAWIYYYNAIKRFKEQSDLKNESERIEDILDKVLGLIESVIERIDEEKIIEPIPNLGKNVLRRPFRG